MELDNPTFILSRGNKFVRVAPEDKYIAARAIAAITGPSECMLPGAWCVTLFLVTALEESSQVRGYFTTKEAAWRFLAGLTGGF